MVNGHWTTRSKLRALSYAPYAPLVVQTAEKDNSVVLLDGDIYVNDVKNVLTEQIKSEKFKSKTWTLNFQVNLEKRINELLRILKSSGSLSVNQYKKI